MSYKQFIEEFVPEDRKRAVRRPCFYILILSLVFLGANNMIAAADYGFAYLLTPDMLLLNGFNLLVMLPMILLSSTMKPWAAVLTAGTGALVLTMNILNSDSLGGILPLAFGLAAIRHTREIREAYNKYIQTGEEPHFAPLVDYANATPKASMGYKAAMLTVGIIGIALVGLLSVAASDESLGRTQLSSEFTADNWEEGVILNAEDLMYVECYAYEGEDIESAEVLYMIGVFDGQDGQYMCSVRVDNTDDVWDEVYDYTLDEYEEMGSLIRTGGGPTSLMPLDDTAFYDECVEYYEVYFPACTVTYMEIDYTGAEAGAVQGSLWPFTNAAAAFFLCLEGVLYMGLRRKRREDQPAEAAEEGTARLR